ncbi:protein piccolo-like [Etheostoma cragini]|uniref:protein piccolo-like n=1 Tax=Etheostoma cragini TaxID=417921 RepID=UPI00155E288E|nr:protein piccolo-like [Etheostoma cragini]
MFSSKFLSGANPLNAVSSAVNKFGLFGDDGQGDKNKKAPSQQGTPSGGQQPGLGPDKVPQQLHGPQKSGQGPPMQKGQPPPKQGSPQLHGNGQAGPPNKPGVQQDAPKEGTQAEDQLKGQPQKNQPKGPPQQGLPKPGDQQHNVTKSGVQPGSPKASTQQVPPKTGVQQGPAKTGVQESTTVGSQKTGSQQRSPKVGQQQGSPNVSQQQKGSAGVAQQQQGSSKVGQQQQGFRTTPQQQSSEKPGPQQQGPMGSGTPGLSRAAASSPEPTKGESQSKRVAKSLCPVCKTTELNMHTKEPPNHKTCTQCKTEVCSVCGFSPPDSDGHEWLCLTCQIQRAQGASEPPGPSMKKPTPNRTLSPAAPVKKEMSLPGSPQKLQSTSEKVPAKGEAAKGPESQKQASPASVKKMTPETQRTSGSQKPDQTSQTGRKQSSAPPESGGLFGFGGSKTEAAKPGGMFGFGSSIFSSASTLIASAVQDEPKTTPPVSPKMQSTKETKPATVQKSVQDKKQEQPQQAKAHPVQVKVAKASPETQKAETAAASHNAPKGGQSTCPLCKVMLNMGSKDPPNYNTCTGCKSTVCNQCGFNPMPNVSKGKEWLCLNCQVKRAAGKIEPQNETSLVSSSFKKTTPAQHAVQKTSAPGSPQRKLSTPAAQPTKAEAAKGPDSFKQVSPAPGQKTPQDSQKTGPQKQPEKTNQGTHKQGNVSAAAQEESGGFFGFGGKSQPDAAKPAVTGKMFGFGSSIFSSASTLISSAVQDEPRTTPPLSPKIHPPKDSNSSTVKKSEQEKKPEQTQQSKGPPSAQQKVDKPPSELPKKAPASPVVSKAGHSTCPLCKLELNVGSKDPPNYNTCTECKNTVCNQCGFNPIPNVKEVKEWLCLNCQMQRALGASEPPGTPMIKLQASPNKVPVPASAQNKETHPLDKPQKKDIQTLAESNTKETFASGSKPPTPADQPAKQLPKTEVLKGSESQKQVTPAPGHKTPQEVRKTGLQKPQDQTSQTGHRQSNTTSTTKEESGGFFGFGGPKPQPDATKPAESVGGKMFGFGSSIFSSASTSMNTSVKDDSKTTPPVSPKISAGKANKSPLAQKQEQEKKLESNPSPSPQARQKGPPQDGAASPAVCKAGQSTCPLCKVELNYGSKEPPNYNNCTGCKSTVCNQCGFNPMPNVSEVNEWLCLNCQMQRAVNASELTGPPMKPLSTPTAVHQKITAPNQEESQKIELSKSDAPSMMETLVPDIFKKKGSPTPGSPQKTQATVVTKTTNAAKGLELDTQASPTLGLKTPLDIQGESGSQKPTDQTSQPRLKQSKVTPETKQESGHLFGLSGPATGPDALKTTESVNGKVFGFGSSIFSTSSSLISSAQDESHTTPPGSRKMSSPAQVSPKMCAVPKISPKSTITVSPKISPAREPKMLAQKSEQEKKPEHSATSSQISSNESQATCPLCKVKLNIGSKDLPNYNNCTECNASVCMQCGFNPMPMGEMKRAVGASGPPGPPTLKSQTSSSKVPSPVAVQGKDSFKPNTPQTKDSPGPAVQKKEASEPVSQHRKQSTPSVQPGKPEAPTAPIKQASPAPDHKPPQERQKTVPQKPTDQASQLDAVKPAESVSKRETEHKLSNAMAATQLQSGGFLGMGGGKTQPDAAKPAESTTGKMFGFGSSIFSSASTLITSAVQDQPKTTPPVSPKMSPAKVIKSPSSQKLEQQKKIEPSQQTTPKSRQAKLDKGPSEPPKAAAASLVNVKPGQSTCPLCEGVVVSHVPDATSSRSPTAPRSCFRHLSDTCKTTK